MGEPAICDQDVPVVRLGSPADLVDAVPYLLGFEPQESVVLIAVRGARRRVGLTLRLDLPALLAGPEAFEGCRAHLKRAGADSLLLAVYARQAPEPGGPLPYGERVEQLATTLTADGMDLIETVLVAQGRWWSYLCGNPMCCPPEGVAVRDRRNPSPVMTAATVAGMSVAADRDELERTVQPLPGPRRRKLAAAVGAEQQRWAGAGRAQRAQAAIELWRRAVRSPEPAPEPLPEKDAALLLVGLADIAVRDACCAAVRIQDRTAAYALARQLARTAVHPWDVAPYTLTGWLAWLQGNGVLARAAVDRALVSDPEYRLGLLVEQLLDCGVDPATWDLPDPCEDADDSSGVSG